MKHHLFHKIFATYFIIVTIALFMVGFQSIRHVKHATMDRIEKELFSYADTIIRNSSRADIITTIEGLSTSTNARITMINERGIVMADSEAPAPSMDNHLNRPEIQETRVKGKGKTIRLSSTLDIDTLYVALPIKEGAEITGYLRLARPLTEIKESISSINVLIIKSFFLAIAFSFFLALIFSSRLAAPIKKIDQYTQRIRRGDTQGILRIDTKDEVGDLARNINHMVKELEEKIQIAHEEKAKLEAAFASMTDGILILGHDDCIENANHILLSLFHVEMEDIFGKTLIEVFRNLDLHNALTRFKETGAPVTQEIMIDQADPFFLDVNIASVREDKAGHNKIIVVFHDITRLKKLEKMRSDFVANVTHEIKTPLTAIIGFVETLLEGAMSDTESATKFLGIIYNHALRLNRLINDLIIISDIEFGKTVLSLEPLSIAGAIENALPIINSRAEEKNIAIEKTIPDSLPAIHGDRDKLIQIFVNILDNAVKFTPDSGRITIQALNNHDGTVSVSITDTGIGIPSSEIPRLGERFYRIDKTRSRKFGGTGLGLSIVKHFMQVHKGTMHIDSTPGKGTTVSLVFPEAKD